MIYLASPYSDPDPEIVRSRFRAARDHAARMLREGRLVYSPIVHGHPMAALGVPRDWSFWEKHNRKMLSVCDALHVLALPGFTRSVGVAAEIEIAKDLEIPIELVGAS